METVGGNVFVICCCKANYHKLRGWKQQTFIISHFKWVRVSPALRLTGCIKGVFWAVFSSGAGVPLPSSFRLLLQFCSLSW